MHSNSMGITSHATRFAHCRLVSKEVLHVYSEDGIKGGQDIFVFDYGCVVFWGVSKTEETAFIDALKACSEGRR